MPLLSNALWVVLFFIFHRQMNLKLLIVVALGLLVASRLPCVQAWMSKPSQAYEDVDTQVKAIQANLDRIDAQYRKAALKYTDPNDQVWRDLLTDYTLAHLNMARMRQANTDAFGGLSSCENPKLWKTMQDVKEWFDTQDSAQLPTNANLRELAKIVRRAERSPGETPREAAKLAKQELQKYMGATGFVGPDETPICCRTDEKTIQCPDAIQGYLPGL